MWYAHVRFEAPAPDLQLESVGRRFCGIKTHRVYPECRGYVDSVLERSLTTENLKGEWTCPFPLLNLMKLNLWVGKKKSLRFIVLRIYWDGHLISAGAKEGGNRWEELIILAKLFFEQDDSWTSTKVFNDLLSLLHNKVNLSCLRSLNRVQGQTRGDCGRTHGYSGRFLSVPESPGCEDWVMLCRFRWWSPPPLESFERRRRWQKRFSGLICCKTRWWEFPFSIRRYFFLACSCSRDKI